MSTRTDLPVTNREARTPSTKVRLRHSIEIDADVATVWALTTDVEALPSLTSTMTAVHVLEDGPLDVGSVVRIKQPAQRTKVWTVTEFEPNLRFSWVTRSMGSAVTAIHDLQATATGTTNTLTIEIAGRRAPLLARLIRRPVLAALAKENLGFKTAAETVRTSGAARRLHH